MKQLTAKSITSIEVAEMVKKDHKNVLRDIRVYVEELAELKIEPSNFFSEGSYLDVNNQSRPCYMVTLKGCEFIGNKLTGIKGTEFTAKYINRFHDMEDVITSTIKPLTDREMMRIQLNMLDDVAERVDKLENTMVIDYGQQRVLERLVNSIVIISLGGKENNAYKEIGKKVFSECNRDIKDHFNVNSRNNIPRLRFEEACSYIKKWQPCTNTKILIDDANAQMNIA